MRKVDLFHIGPQKSGTTWLYTCLKQHPEIVCAKEDSVHYYDMHYHMGSDWYFQHFPTAQKGQLTIDHTPSYIRSPWVPERIFTDNPEAKIILCLREPIERSFSHYWHEKKKNKINFRFNEILTNYDLYSSWLETGFYAEHIERFLKYFPRERILAQRFDLLKRSPSEFLSEFFNFVGVSLSFQPTVLDRKINEAGAKQDFFNRYKRRLNHMATKVLGDRWCSGPLAKRLTGKDEYLKGVGEDLRAELLKATLPEVQRLENLLGIDLSEWKE